MTLDSYPVSISMSGDEFPPIEDALIVTKSGDLWMIDFQEQATL